MQTNRKALGILLILLGLIIIAVIVYFLFIKKNATEQPLAPGTSVTGQLPAGEEKGNDHSKQSAAQLYQV